MSRATWDASRILRDFGYGPVTLYGTVFHRLFLSFRLHIEVPLPRRTSPPVWAVPLSLATTGGISFPPGTEMFHFPGLAAKPYFVRTPLAGHDPRRVFPFGNLRIKACLPLPEAYRSLPRPSSPVDAKASVMRPFELDQNCFGQS